MANRIRHALPALAGYDDQECWNCLFTAPPGQQRARSFDYMIERTLYRPREIIQFSTQVIECAQYGQAGPPWPHATITEAESLYSADRVRDIAAEYRFQWPGLLSVIETFRGQSRVIDRDDLELLALGLITRDIPSAGTGAWLDECSPDGLIEILWQVGLLLAEADPGSGAALRDPGRPAGVPFLGSHQARPAQPRYGPAFPGASHVPGLPGHRPGLTARHEYRPAVNNRYVIVMPIQATLSAVSRREKRVIPFPPYRQYRSIRIGCASRPGNGTGERGGSHVTTGLAVAVDRRSGRRLNSSGDVRARAGSSGRGRSGQRAAGQAHSCAEEPHRAQVRTPGVPGSGHLGRVTRLGVPA